MGKSFVSVAYAGEKIMAVRVRIPWVVKAAKNNRIGRVIPRPGRDGVKYKTAKDFMVAMQKTDVLERDENALTMIFWATTKYAQRKLKYTFFEQVMKMAGDHIRKRGIGKQGLVSYCAALGVTRPHDTLFGEDEVKNVITFDVFADDLIIEFHRVGSRPSGKTGRRLDIQNLFATVCDAANGSIYNDDRCICHAEAKKAFKSEPCEGEDV